MKSAVICDQKPLTLTLSQRERELIALFGRGTPTWNIASNADHEKRSDLRSKAPHPNPLPVCTGDMVDTCSETWWTVLDLLTCRHDLQVQVDSSDTMST
ncbi:hypothetical protein, partial [Pseudomonas sp. PS02286]|uniref:hypothetical protein n=1 Tax=Pseudomonas sp. PS02286 TaxID=2991442 RepID=UPI00249ACCB6